MQSYRAAILTLVMLFYASFAAAQSKGTFQAATSTPAGPATIPSNTGFLLGGIQPIQIVAGDFNGDGKQDFVAGASCSQGSANGQYGIPNCPAVNGSVIVTYLGNGDGTFQPELVNAGPAPGLRSIAVADFNGDGILDVAAMSDSNSVNPNFGTLTIMLGKGDGTFTAGQSYSVSGAAIGANTISTGDLNGDGRQDIVIGLGCDFSNSGCSTGAVLVFLGNGDGTFQTPKDYPTVGNQALPVLVGDFNKDGKQDVLLSSFVSPSGGTLIFFPGNGDGTLGTPVSTALPGFSGGTALAAADFNSDGNLDAVTVAPNGVAVAFGNGDGTFQPATTYSTNGGFAESVVTADVNGDGKPDIVVGEGAGGASVLVNDGTGNFGNIANYSMNSFEGVSVAVGDFNGDGKNDVLLTANLNSQSSSDGTISLLLGNGDGTFRSAQYVSTAGVSAGVGSVAAADFNSDGFQDLIIPVCQAGCNGNSGFALFLSDGAGGYQAPVSFTSSTSEAGDVIIGDFNGDGKPDVALFSGCDATCSGDAVTIFLNTGNGTFADGVVYEIGGLPGGGIVTGDFNGDGKLDIAVLNSCATPTTCGVQGSVGILLGNGDGTFQPVISTPIDSPNVWWLAAADFNGDKRTDLAVANGTQPMSAQILISNGDGTFTFGGSYPSGGGNSGGGPNGNGSAVVAGDVNGDGIPDLVFANLCEPPVEDQNCANGEIGVLLGNGDGTFQAVNATTVPDANFNGVSLADVNKDGKLDIVASVGTGIVVFLGNGDGTFQNPTTYSGGASAGVNQMAIADLRNDGGLDVVQSDSQLTIFYDEGFTLPSTTTTLQSSLNPSVYAENATFTATVTSSSGTPTGTVTFTVDGASFGSVELSGGTASITAPLLNTGTHSIVASYGGDGDHGPSNSAALAQVVNPATTATVVTSSANPSYVTQTITYTATVTSQFSDGFVTGSITFMDGKTNLGGIIIAHGFPVGKASVSISEKYNTTGAHSITAIYSGDGNNLASTSAALKQSVDALPAVTKTVVTTSGSPSPINQAVTFTATVTSTFGPIPNGENVTFTDGVTTLGSVPLANGTAALTTSALKSGTQSVKAAYAGDVNFKSSVGIVTQVVSLYATTTTLSSTLTTSNFGQSVTLTSTVTSTGPSAPTGTVFFKNGAANIGSAKLNASGTATLTLSTLPVGTLSLTSAYNGDSESAKSTSSALAETVNQAQVTMTLTSTPNPSTAGKPVKFTATFTSNGGLPTGTVTFSNGATNLGSATISGGKATFSTTALPVGTNTVTASYSGSADYSPASGSVIQQVN